MAVAKKAGGPIELTPPKISTVKIPIIGVTPLITHNWSEKAKRQIADKQGGKAVAKKAPKIPEEDYEGAFYRFEDGRPGFPASGFKAAIVGGARMFDGIPMTKLKVAVRVEAEDASGLVEIKGSAPKMREDMVRLETGVADIRYRPEFTEWHATLTITFNESMLSQEQLVNLVNAAGFGGVGEWRPSAPRSASGSYGCFRVKTAADE